MAGHRSTNQSRYRQKLNTFLRERITEITLKMTVLGEKWQTRRKLLTPAFHFSVLQQYFKSISENGRNTIEELLSKGEAVYDVNDLVADHTFRIICGIKSYN